LTVLLERQFHHFRLRAFPFFPRNSGRWGLKVDWPRGLASSDLKAAISSIAPASASTPIASASNRAQLDSNKAWTLSHLWTCWQAWLSKPAAYDLQGHITS